MTRGTSLHLQLIVTEHPGYLSHGRQLAYSELADMLEKAAGLPVSACHYLDVERPQSGLAGVVIGGAVAPWVTYNRATLDRLSDYVTTVDRPTLGICAGMQLIAEFAGGRIDHASRSECGFGEIDVVADDELFRGLPRTVTMYQQHTDHVVEVPSEFRIIAQNDVCVQALTSTTCPLWGTQFHPERADAAHPDGYQVISNFVQIVRAHINGVRRPADDALDPLLGRLMGDD